jgi:hypothetical protein
VSARATSRSSGLRRCRKLGVSHTWRLPFAEFAVFHSFHQLQANLPARKAITFGEVSNLQWSHRNLQCCQTN